MESEIIPQIGEVKSGTKLGYSHRKPMVWLQCSACGRCRWVQLRSTKEPTFTGLCADCSRKSTKQYRRGGYKNTQGRIRLKAGYYKVRVYPDDFFAFMADKAGYVLEHRLVMAKSLGRCLHRWEIVHHKNGDKGDNRQENLQLVTDDRHRQITILEERIKYLEGLLIKASVSFNCK